MQLMQPFNAQQFDPKQSAGQLPIGKHPVVIDSSEVKANKSQDGGYLQLNLRITAGPQQGTTGAYRLNLYHNNQTTVDIANRQLSAICHVLGVYQVSDSSQLHNLPFMIEVGPQKNDPQYTEVKKVFDQNGNEPQRAGQPAAQQQPAPVAAPVAAPAAVPQWQPQQAVPAQVPAAPQWAPAAPQQAAAPAAPQWQQNTAAQAAPTAPWGAPR